MAVEDFFFNSNFRHFFFFFILKIFLATKSMKNMAIGLLVPENKIFKGFLPYMEVVAIVVMWPDQVWLAYHKESSNEILVQLA